VANRTKKTGVLLGEPEEPFPTTHNSAVAFAAVGGQASSTGLLMDPQMD